MTSTQTYVKKSQIVTDALKHDKERKKINNLLKEKKKMMKKHSIWLQHADKSSNSKRKHVFFLSLPSSVDWSNTCDTFLQPQQTSGYHLIIWAQKSTVVSPPWLLMVLLCRPIDKEILISRKVWLVMNIEVSNGYDACRSMTIKLIIIYSFFN